MYAKTRILSVLIIYSSPVSDFPYDDRSRVLPLPVLTME